jgi:hypothetical protein
MGGGYRLPGASCRFTAEMQIQVASYRPGFAECLELLGGVKQRNRYLVTGAYLKIFSLTISILVSLTFITSNS